jgi:hypothetical protein
VTKKEINENGSSSTQGRLPGIVPSKFNSILGLYHHGVTGGHHGQWNSQRKCAVRLWNHAWDVEDVWSSSWTVEIVETDTRRTYTHCSKTDTSYGMYSYVMHILLSAIQDLLLRTKYVCTWRGLSVGTAPPACYSLSYPQARWSHHDYP